MHAGHEPLDAALAILADRGPVYGGDFANHGPMAAEALATLGRDQDVVAWTAAYAKRLEAAPQPAAALPLADWRRALGREATFAAWEAAFAAALAAQRWQDVVATWAGRLLPGLAGAAGHGVIRAAHAVRALTAKDTPLRRQELARGLAYWASTFVQLPGGAGNGAGLASAVLPRVPLLPPARRRGSGSITSGIADLDGFHAFAAAAAEAGPGEAEAFLDDLLATAARLFVQSGRISPIAFTHAVTGAAAVRILWPHLDAAAHTAGCRAAWQFAAALHSRFADAPFRAEAVPAPHVAPDELVERAVTNGDEHAIKLTQACVSAWQTDPKPEFLAAARLGIELM